MKTQASLAALWLSMKMASRMFVSSLLQLLTLLMACLATSAETGLKFEKRAGALPTLTLPYGTYRADNFNPDGEVGKSYKRPGKKQLTTTKDLHLQKHSFRRTACGELKMGKTRSSSNRRNNARWLLWTNLCPSTYQRNPDSRSGG